MLGHTNRNDYYIASEGKVASGCPFHAGPGTAAAAAPAPASNYRFDWMYGKSEHTYTPAEQEYVKGKLTDLGNLMNKSAGVDPDQSQIPSGYTYLGQFIAHEISFDQTKGLVLNTAIPDNDRSPQIELDSLYGGGPGVDPHLFEADHARLKIGETLSISQNVDLTLPNDLPRKGTGDNPIEALIGDPRNDENLAVAQTHVAFIRFHNEVVKRLEAAGTPEAELFERAREQVVRHFHWIILNDFLPRVLDPDVLQEVLASEIEWCKGKTKDELFMPLEFSAAAFRFGHSMIRNTYEWNSLHTSVWPLEPATLLSLFNQTAFSGDLGGKARLPRDWVIDWRRFFDFAGFAMPLVAEFNFSRRIDTAFDMHLDQLQFSNFPHEGLNPDQLAIPTRNLIRGFTLNLPTGEELAERFNEEPLAPEVIANGPYNRESEAHQALFADPVLNGRTPLWYYILKEAELNDGHRLGRVGSRIIAETLVGLIRNSRYSFAKEPQWRPAFHQPAAAPERFGMVDLIVMAGVVDPISRV